MVYRPPKALKGPNNNKIENVDFTKAKANTHFGCTTLFGISMFENRKTSNLGMKYYGSYRNVGCIEAGIQQPIALNLYAADRGNRPG